MYQKKYGGADYQYFKKGNIQQCDIFRHGQYNCYLVVSEVLTPYVKHNKSYERKWNYGSNGTWVIKQQSKT